MTSTLGGRGATVAAAARRALGVLPSAARAQARRMRHAGPRHRRVAQRIGPGSREQPVRGGAAIAVGAEIRVPPGGWLRLARARRASAPRSRPRACWSARTRAWRPAGSDPDRGAQPARARGAGDAAGRASRPRTRTAGSRWRSVAGRASGCTSGVAARGVARRLRRRCRRCAGDAVLVSPGEPPRLDTWPFARRPPTSAPRTAADAAPGVLGRRRRRARSAAARPGHAAGWPLRPFHRQHPLRAGLNERRPANMHEGVDIQAQDGTRVYAMQSGTARVLKAGHRRRARRGRQLPLLARPSPRAQRRSSSRAYATVVGTIINGAGHLHLSELSGRALSQSAAPGRSRAGAVERHAGTRHRRPRAGARRARERRGLRPAVLPGPDQVPHSRAGSGGARLPRLGHRRTRRDRAAVRAARLAAPARRRALGRLRRRRLRARLDVLRHASGVRPALGLPPRRRSGAAAAAHGAAPEHLRVGLGGQHIGPRRGRCAQPAAARTAARMAWTSSVFST